MNLLLIFFAIPVAVIIISAILQKILKCPVEVAALIFAIFLIITFAVFDATFLIATLAYTILAFITAIIVKFICASHNNDNICDLLNNILSRINNGNTVNENETSNCLNNILNSNNSSNNNNSNNNSCGCGCNRYRRF